MFVVLNLGLLAGCNQLPALPNSNNQEVSKGPDIMDRVRSLDLLPRFPQQADATGQGEVAAGSCKRVRLPVSAVRLNAVPL